MLIQDFGTFSINYCIGVVNQINNTISIFLFHFDLRLYDHLYLLQYFKYCYIHLIRIKIKQILINQKRNTAEVNPDNDDNSE